MAEARAGRGNVARDLRRLKRVSFFCKHRARDNEVRKKTYTIDGFESNAIEYKFELKRRNADGGVSTQSINAYDYFMKQYNLRLKYPHLPLIKTRKKGEVFPMELAYIVEVNAPALEDFRIGHATNFQ